MTFERVRLGSLAEVAVSNVDKHSVDGQPIVRLCNYTDVYYQHALDQSREYMVATASPDQIQKFRLQVDDVVITKDSETADDIGIPALITETADDFVCGYHLAILRPSPQKTDGRYLNWVLQSDDLKAQFENIAFGVTRVGLKTGRIKTLEIPVPGGQSAQARVADYLDRETAPIDALIDKQRAMRDLLAARRIRVMHALVTGQERERRASSEHWFGSLPLDWNSARLSHLSQIALGKMINARTVSPDQTTLPYLAAGSIQPDRLILDECKVMNVNEDEIEKYSLKSGDVVVVEGGAGYGRSHVLRASLRGWVFQNHVARVRVDRGRLEPRYLRGALEVCRGSGFFEANNRTATLPSLSREVLGALVIPLPPLVEQREIADHLDRETAKIDALIAKAERFIELAQERRAALITAAVTGQIEIPTED
ncbi:restriction endonuclease subunit S [Corynebacterium glyciniphilum]|uniref:restriction endonuclease subunit S n=1 Tax=Corynebacterium glyciniphilum TaxID=1404244 RepID=UPI002651D455|nr:restriction endonuclease subunit S [Corynebacterium glyciniphilum]MDN5683705.1 restriction endonuclease subunit S [Corynebacterium glyciniphilum]